MHAHFIVVSSHIVGSVSRAFGEQVIYDLIKRANMIRKAYWTPDIWFTSNTGKAAG